MRDLRVYAEALDGSLYHYRDSSGLECDTVLQRRDGSYALLEVKLGGTERIEEGATNLKELANKLDTTKCLPPRLWLWLLVLDNMLISERTGCMLSLLAA